MSCPCNPKTGPEFDPDREGPSDADLCRFGGDDTEYFFDDELGGYGSGGAAGGRRAKGLRGWTPVIAAGLVVGFVVMVLAGLFEL